MRMCPPLGTGLCMVVLLAASGCSSGARADEACAPVPEGVLSDARLSDDGHQWESAPWNGAAWIDFRDEACVIIDHDLGRRPMQVLPYLSFERDDSDDDGRTRSSALASGDLARVLEVTDTQVTLRNDTNADVFLRVVVE